MVEALLAAGAEMTIHVAAALGDLQEVDRILAEIFRMAGGEGLAPAGDTAVPRGRGR